MLKFCKKCGASVPEQTTFCKKCGVRLQAPSEAGVPPNAAGGYQNIQNAPVSPMFSPVSCNKCGSKNEQGSLFCSVCGGPVGAQAQMPAYAQQPAMPYAPMPQPAGAGKSSIFKAVAIGGVAIVVLAVVGFIVMNFVVGIPADGPDANETLVVAPVVPTEPSPDADEQPPAEAEPQPGESEQPPDAAEPPAEAGDPPADTQPPSATPEPPPATPEPPPVQDIDSRLFGAWEWWEDDEGAILFMFSEDFTGALAEMYWGGDRGWAGMFEFQWSVSDNMLVMTYDGEDERIDFRVIDRNSIEIYGERLFRIETTELVGFDLHGSWEPENNDAMFVFDGSRDGRLHDWERGETEFFRWLVFDNLLVIVGDDEAFWETFSVIDRDTIRLFGGLWFRI